MSLTQKTCVPCQGGIPPLTADEAKDYLVQVPGWELSSAGDRINRKFAFDDFVASLDFVNKVGAVAEQEGHRSDELDAKDMCALSGRNSSADGR